MNVGYRGSQSLDIGGLFLTETKTTNTVCMLARFIEGK